MRYRKRNYYCEKQKALMWYRWQSGRNRADASITMDWEMIKEFYWQFSYSEDYDRDPPGPTSANDDYSLYSGLAYKFN